MYALMTFLMGIFSPFCHPMIFFHNPSFSFIVSTIHSIILSGHSDRSPIQTFSPADKISMYYIRPTYCSRLSRTLFQTHQHTYTHERYSRAALDAMRAREMDATGKSVANRQRLRKLFSTCEARRTMCDTHNTISHRMI